MTPAGPKGPHEQVPPMIPLTFFLLRAGSRTPGDSALPRSEPLDIRQAATGRAQPLSCFHRGRPDRPSTKLIDGSGRWTLSSTAEPGSRQTERDPADTSEHSPMSARQHTRRAYRTRLRQQRERIRARRSLNTTYRFALGTLGTLVLLAGIAMIPYPGPGWLVVFGGLGILATEFNWAHRLNLFAKKHYHRWMAWLQRQNIATKLAVMSGTGVVVVVTLWLCGAFALVGSLFDAHWSWLASPLFGP